VTARLIESVGRAGPQDRSGRPDRPNFVLIMADDLGYGDLGCYGSRRTETPNLDALAAEGLRFTDYHSNGPVCSPTRAALLTGRYQQRCGVDEVIYAKGPARQTGMGLEQVTFAEVLKAAGYVTGIVGKWHLGYRVEFNPRRQGFDEFVGYVSGNIDYHSHIDGAGIADWWHGEQKVHEQGYVTDLITTHAVDFIRRHRAQPFCLYVAHEAPHYPYQGRKDPPERLPGGAKAKRARGNQVGRAYKQMIQAMDEGVGRIVQTLRQLGLAERTLVFFCSDNGATRHGSNGPLRGLKGSLWEGGHRVPAIAWWPGHITPGRVSGETVLGMDLFATMASLGRARLPEGLELDGVDLSGLLLAEKPLQDRLLFWAYRDQRAVRQGPWKLLIRSGRSELYNLAEDLGEHRDLSAQHAKLVEQLRAALQRWEKEVFAKS